MGFEPTTPTLARLCSTPELHPRPYALRTVSPSDSGALYGASAQLLQQISWPNMNNLLLGKPVRITTGCEPVKGAGLCLIHHKACLIFSVN